MRDSIIKDICPACGGALAMRDMPHIEFNRKGRKLLCVICTNCPATVRLHAEEPMKGYVHSFVPNQSITVVPSPRPGAA